MLTYTLAYIYHFFAAGILIAYLVGLRKLGPLIAFPLSYLLLVINLMAVKALDGSVGVYSLLINGQILLLATLTVARAEPRRRVIRDTLEVAAALRQSFQQTWRQQMPVFASVIVFAALTAYFLYVGPYTEVPADAWVHIGKLQESHQTIITTGTFRSVDEWTALLGKNAFYWYDLHAYLFDLAGITVREALLPLSTLNSLVLLATVFVFTLLIVGDPPIIDRHRVYVALLAVIFFTMHFGVNVFSYVRYYVFGPAILNYAVFLISLVLIRDCIQISHYRKHVYFLLLLLFVVLMALVHIQESLFTLIMFALMLTYAWALSGSRAAQTNIADAPHGEAVGARWRPRHLSLLFWTTALMAVSALLFIHFTLERSDPLAYGRLIPLQQVLPFFRHMFILDPRRELYQVLTLWGFVVYLLFFFRWKWFRPNIVLVAGMLSPVFTVLNPVFSDAFLRIHGTTVFWRLLYMVPLASVAAVIFWRALLAIRLGTSVVGRVKGLLAAVTLVGLLFPIDFVYLVSPYSRLQTLKKVDEQNDYHFWQDLYDYLDTLERPYQVLTDPVTGYTLRALTKHQYSGKKFFASGRYGYRHFNFENYTAARHARYRGWLLIINRRDGAHSVTGALSGHWSEGVLYLDRHYDDGLLTFVQARPDIFEKLWEQDEITVYRITPDPSP